MYKRFIGPVAATAMLAGALLTGCSDSETTTDDDTSTTTTGPTTGPGGGQGAGGPGAGGQGAGGPGSGGQGGGGAAVCGDGIKAASEECDDGDTDALDGCDADCDVEDGYLCTGTMPSVCAPECGDGQIFDPEECDDGDTDPLDGCSDTCTREAGFVCPTPNTDCIALDGTCTYPFEIVLADNAGTLEGNAAGTTAGGSDDVAVASCDGGAVGDGADLVYSFTLPDARDVTILTTFSTADGVVRVLTAPCDPSARVGGEIAFGDGCADQAGAAGAETLNLLGLAAGTYYVVIDGSADSDEGAFTIDIDATASGCGDGTVSGNEECDDMNSDMSDGCFNCVLEPLYTCSGMPSSCTLTCGDGTVDFDALEQCDDGNAVDDDRCDNSCALVFDVEDMEPNDSNVDAQTVLENEIVFGTIDVAGDFDVYELTLAADAWVSVEAYLTVDGLDTNYNGLGTLDPLVDCTGPGATNDLIAYVFDSTGDVTVLGDAILSDDDDGDGLCPFIGSSEDRPGALLAAGTYYIRINALSASATFDQYALDVRTDVPLMVGETCDVDFDYCDVGGLLTCDAGTDMCTLTCGDGTVDSGEECDDANAVDDDRCSNACVLNADVIDVAGNDDFANAQPIAPGEIAKGSTDDNTDPWDIYSFTLATDSWVVVETYNTVDGSTANYNGDGLDDTMDCNSDADVRIFDAGGDPTSNGTALAYDDADGDGACGYLGPNNDGAAVLLAAGTYYIKVNEFFDNDPIPLYALDFQVLAPLGLSEVCDPNYDLCDPAGGVSCDGSTNLCSYPPPPAVDHTSWEQFTSDDFDLHNTTLTFTPTGGTYGVLASAAAAYPDTPGSGTEPATTTLTLSDDGAASVSFGFDFPFYGVAETSLFVNANGNITFGVSSGEWDDSAAEHFALPRISAFFDDLSPNDAGTVYVDEYPDRLVVTYDDVDNFDNDASVFVQVQLFVDGTITITHLLTTEVDGLVGISRGDDAGNIPAELDFSAQTPVSPMMGDLVINELLADPTGVDSNCDAAFDIGDDEFVEIVNVSGFPLDLTGVTVSDGAAVRHTFGAVVLPHGTAIVVFGGGTPNCADVNAVVASTGALGLQNTGGETVTLSTGDTLSYAIDAPVGVSMTLDFDLVGILRNHDIAGGAAGAVMSPGFRVTGDAF